MTVPRPAPAIGYIHPRTLTVLATYRCNASCENCCFDSNPGLTQRIDLDDILAFIEQGASSPSVQVVTFSGGECFLLGEDLVRAVEFAASRDLRTRCVTNGFWAKSLTAGRRCLTRLRDAGLCELNVSTGDFHQQWVAESTAINAACLGVELGLEHTLMVIELQKTRRVTAERLGRDRRVADLLSRRPDNGFDLIESPWMPMHPSETIDQEDRRFVDRHNLHQRKGCKSVLSTVVITPARKIGFCCGLSRERIPELNVDWNDHPLSELLEHAGTEFMKIWLFVDGPERILAWAAAKDPRIDWEGRYAHHCHSCLALYQDPLVRQVIAENYRERVEDVLMRYSVLLRKQELVEGAVYA